MIPTSPTSSPLPIIYSFDETLSDGAAKNLGDIPIGVANLTITIVTTGADLDIQLFDKSDGDTPIVG
jgi:hypothetical protein